ncbi:MAG: hypothetical protein JNJ89_00150 [Rubrivivax sp.]|nr:hypothetical protein [Rubrivivax sp.]
MAMSAETTGAGRVQRRHGATRVLSLRHGPGDDGPVAAALRQHLGIAVPPRPGQWMGADPYLVWCRPSEWLLVGHEGVDPAAWAALAADLRAGRHAAAVAVDVSAGFVTYELQGADIDARLARVIDAASIARRAGEGGRARLAEVAVVQLRLAPGRLWLLVDRAVEAWVGEWLDTVA